MVWVCKLKESKGLENDAKKASSKIFHILSMSYLSRPPVKETVENMDRNILNQSK